MRHHASRDANALAFYVGLKKPDQGGNLKNGRVHELVHGVVTSRACTPITLNPNRYHCGSATLHVHFVVSRRQGRNILYREKYCAIFVEYGGVNPNARQGLAVWVRQTDVSIDDARPKKDQALVLVGVVEGADHGEGHVRRFGELVRLQVLDDCDRFVVHPTRLLRETFPTFLVENEGTFGIHAPRIIGLNRETGVRPSFLAGNARPEDVINGTSQVVHEITEQEGGIDAGLFGYVDDVVPSLFLSASLDPSLNIVRVAICVAPGFLVDVREVILRPLELESPGLQVRHDEVSSKHERQPAGPTETKDHKRTRDSYPHAGRVHSQPEKDGEAAKALNSQPPEEVASQTSPVRRHGANSATRTHLGSPEDA